MTIPRILHYPGSKWSMPWIVDYFPEGYEKMGYLEMSVGSGATLFQKNPSVLETINDIDGDVVNLFRMIRTRCEELAEVIKWTPYARDEYYLSYDSGGGRRFGTSKTVSCAMLDGKRRKDKRSNRMAQCYESERSTPS
jgi:DNA adenine methylase